MAAIKMAERLGDSQTSAPCRPDPLAPLLGLLKVRASFPLLGQCLSNTSLCWVLTDQTRGPAQWICLLLICHHQLFLACCFVLFKVKNYGFLYKKHYTNNFMSFFFYSLWLRETALQKSRSSHSKIVSYSLSPSTGRLLSVCFQSLLHSS